MPELPEVESVRKSLLPFLADKEISHIEIRKNKIVRAEHFESILKGAIFADPQRRAKLLIFPFKNREEIMIGHLKMTGQFLYQDDKNTVGGGHSLTPGNLPSLPHKHTHVIFHFTDQTHLFFNDMRQFGYLDLVTPTQLATIIERSYGIEPLTDEFTLENFKKIFIGRKTNIKALLLNQKLIAGLGNIYVDEICYACQIRPDRLANKVSINEQKMLFQATQDIIKKAIDCGGTTFQYYTDARGVHGNFKDHLQVFGKTGLPCPNTSCPIEKSRVAGRGTHWSPNWQK